MKGGRDGLAIRQPNSPPTPPPPTGAPAVEVRPLPRDFQDPELLVPFERPGTGPERTGRIRRDLSSEALEEVDAAARFNEGRLLTESKRLLARAQRDEADLWEAVMLVDRTRAGSDVCVSSARLGAWFDGLSTLDRYLDKRS